MAEIRGDLRTAWEVLGEVLRGRRAMGTGGGGVSVFSEGWGWGDGWGADSGGLLSLLLPGGAKASC